MWPPTCKKHCRANQPGVHGVHGIHVYMTSSGCSVSDAGKAAGGYNSSHNLGKEVSQCPLLPKCRVNNQLLSGGKEERKEERKAEY